ncbi:hypothetical protein [Pseudodonghicola xiamenensis]|uniref:Uncharacterized protein n=1 Tax=Pseudodonghicola xiamenensis TaxID=337702 RepID=A0A8J3MGA2_9RHOB|nr:hypothetical protein [Pseudodonghicola xiamenensis]GHG99757.1 hypothetical protein GCM10010961_35860 [Pseudodonghicola xiamenensis]
MPQFQVREAADRSVALHVCFEDSEKSIFTSVQWCPREKAWTARWQSRETIAGWLKSPGPQGEEIDDCDIECLRHSLVSPHVLAAEGEEVLEEIERITGVPSYQLEWLMDDLSGWTAAIEEALTETALERPREEAQQLLNALLRNALERTVAMIDGEVDLEFEGTPVAPVTRLGLN